MTDEPMDTAPDVETPAVSLAVDRSAFAVAVDEAQAAVEDLGDWMADQMAERSKTIAANEADNGMRALYGPDYADKAAN